MTDLSFTGGGRAGSRSYIVTALLMIALIPCLGMADGRGKDGRGGKSQRIQQIFAEIGIIPEQETMLRDIHAKAGPARQVHMKQVEVLRAKIKQELQKEKPSKGALNKYATEMGSLHKQMNQASIDIILQIKAVLTPEQYARLSEHGLIGGPDGIKMRGGKSGDYKGECKSAFKPGEGPKHRYGGGQSKQGGPKYKGDGPGQRERCTPEKCAHVCRFEKRGGNPPGGGGFQPIAPPIGTIPEDADIGVTDDAKEE